VDTMSAVEMARRAGVSLPTAHAMLDREGVARTGRGIERRVPRDVAERVIEKRVPGYRPTEIRVLAALSVSPLGLSSVRRVAEIAGISTTTASSALTRLVDTGLVQRKARRSIRAGRVVAETVYALNMRSENWPAVKSAVRGIWLHDHPVAEAKRVPQQFWHLFWNATPATLRVSGDGAYIARRMLNSSSMAAAQWALEHISPTDLRAAVAGRGADERTRALVRNWIARQGSS